MDELSKLGGFALLGDADHVPQSLLVSYPEQAKTLKLLYEVSRELTSILDREELLRRVAESVRKIDRKSTRLNSSHGYISYAVFCLKKKNHVPAPTGRYTRRRGRRKRSQPDITPHHHDTH